MPCQGRRPASGWSRSSAGRESSRRCSRRSRPGDHERALELLLEQAKVSNGEARDRIRELMVALFEELGQEHELSTRYRRQLASTLY